MALAIPGSPKTNSLLAPECSFRKRFGRPVLAKAAWFIPTLSHGIKHQAAQGMWIHLHEPPVSSWDRENLWETLLLTNPTGHGYSVMLGLALPRGFSWIHEAWDQLRAPSRQREVFPVGRGTGAAAGRSRGNCSSREISRDSFRAASQGLGIQRCPSIHPSSSSSLLLAAPARLGRAEAPASPEMKNVNMEY